MLNYFYALPLSRKGAAIVALAITVTGLLLTFAAVAANQSHLKVAAEAQAWQQLSAIALRAQAPLAEGNAIPLHALLKEYESQANVGKITVFDIHERALAEVGRRGGSWKLSRVIGDSEAPVGHVVMVIDEEAVNTESRLLMAVLVMLILICAAFAWALILAPLKKIEDALRRARHVLRQPLDRGKVSAYPGRDVLSDLLQEIHAPKLQRDVSSACRSELVMHCVWLKYAAITEQWDAWRLGEAEQRHYLYAERVAQLFRVRMRVYEPGSVTLFFPLSGQNAESLHHALSAASLLKTLCDEVGAHARIGLFEAEGSRWQLQAATEQFVKSLAQMDSERSSQTTLSLPDSLLSAAERWVKVENSRVVGLQPEQKEDLERQLNSLL